MPTLARPLVVGQRLQQSRELLVLARDRVEQVPDLLAAREAGAAIALLVEVGEQRRGFVEQPPDPESVDVNDHVPKVRQGLQRRPLPLARRPPEARARRAL